MICAIKRFVSLNLLPFTILAVPGAVLFVGGLPEFGWYCLGLAHATILALNLAFGAEDKSP